MIETQLPIKPWHPSSTRTIYTERTGRRTFIDHNTTRQAAEYEVVMVYVEPPQTTLGEF